MISMFSKIEPIGPSHITILILSQYCVYNFCQFAHLTKKTEYLEIAIDE